MCKMDGNLNEIVHCPPRFWTSIKDELIEIGNSEVCDYPQTIQFKIALAYVITFLQKNCTGNCDAADNRLNVFLDKYATFYMNSDDINWDDVESKLKSELLEKIEYIVIAKSIFYNFESTSDNEEIVKYWWLMRALYLNQLILSENCTDIFEKFQHASSFLLNSLSGESDYLKILYLEIFQMNLLFDRIIPANDQLNGVKKLQNVNFVLTGKLGKRTKFQEKEVAQLLLDIQISDSNVGSYSYIVDNRNEDAINDLPPVVPLNDEVRLNKIEFQDGEPELMELNEIEQLIVLAECKYLMRSKPIIQDSLTREEIECYLNAVLNQQHSCWSIRINSMLVQCQLDKFNKRTIERSLRHFESIVDFMNNTAKPGFYRWRYFWAAGHQLRFDVQTALAKRYKELSMLNCAADAYFKLCNWTELIDCYCIMQRNQEAIKLVENLLENDPKLVNLWVLYGDLKENPAFYEKAWDVSDHKSALAQKKWGYYYYDRKEYIKCIDHLEKSLKINYLQNDVMLRLGFAAICIEDYKLAAHYYKMYTNLEPDCFEAWNNLGKAYYHLKDYVRASIASSESLKYDFENWKLWDNFMLFSFKAGHYDDTIRAFHRILDLKAIDKDISYTILSVLCQTSKKESCSDELRKKVAELMARVTILIPGEPQFWELYAFLAIDHETKLQRLLKCYRALNQIGNKNDLEDFLNVAEQISNLLLEHSVQDKSLLHSTKLMLNSALSIFKAKTVHLDCIPDEIQAKVHTIERASRKVLDILEQKNS